MFFIYILLFSLSGQKVEENYQKYSNFRESFELEENIESLLHKKRNSRNFPQNIVHIPKDLPINLGPKN